jgi:hypothetical protein
VQVARGGRKKGGPQSDIGVNPEDRTFTFRFSVKVLEVLLVLLGPLGPLGKLVRLGPLGPLGFDFAQHRQTLRPSVDGIRSKALRP